MVKVWQGSRELLAPPITVDGELTAGGVEFALTDGTGQASWVPATVVRGVPGYLLTGTEPAGTYALWARVTDSLEVPIVRCGFVEIRRRPAGVPQ